ncbi:MAG: hypothetical protein PHU25_18330 [Deltaproteobacteria bacterium]|nr:hypothetical protein [Deltaproteobacteria bacterium]
MTPGFEARALAILRELALSDRPVLALLADGLIAAVEGGSPGDLADPAWREACERITVAAERLALSGGGVAPLVEALVAVDTALAAAGPAPLPWATRLASLAAERFVHAARTRDVEAAHLAAADLSPIVRLDPKTILAAPVGELGEDGLARFCDRILTEALHLGPRRIILVTDGLVSREDVEHAWATLSDDLAAQGIVLERR